MTTEFGILILRWITKSPMPYPSNGSFLLLEKVSRVSIKIKKKKKITLTERAIFILLVKQLYGLSTRSQGTDTFPAPPDRCIVYSYTPQTTYNYTRG